MDMVEGSVLRSGTEKTRFLHMTILTDRPNIWKLVGHTGGLHLPRNNPRRPQHPRGNKAEWHIRTLPTEFQVTLCISRLTIPMLWRAWPTGAKHHYPLRPIAACLVVDESLRLYFDVSVLPFSPGGFSRNRVCSINIPIITSHHHSAYY